MGVGPEDRIRSLDIWQGSIVVEPLSGGMTNRNYLVRDRSRTVAVRLGEDIPFHMISRANELAASQAAHAAGISPAILYHAPGVLVMEYLEAKTYTPEDVRDPAKLDRIVDLVRRCHTDIPRYFRGPAMIFWVFQVIRDYANTLRDGSSPYIADIPLLVERAERLDKAAGPYSIVFGHNDLLAANILDDGKQLWLIDWDYAGFNSPLFDLGGLASNSSLAEEQEKAVLERYFSAPADNALLRRYQAMKCASLLRETMWSMVSELRSAIAFDYKSYTDENRARFERAYVSFEEF